MGFLLVRFTSAKAGTKWCSYACFGDLGIVRSNGVRIRFSVSM